MTHPPIKAPFELPQTEAGASGEQELAFANYEDMIRRQACGDRSEQAVAKARAKLIATLSHPAAQAGAVQAVDDFRSELIAAANYIDALGGDSKSYRVALAATQPSAAPGDEVAPTAPVLPVWWDWFIQNICELPDRNSPEDEPEAMVATPDELENCAIRAMERLAAPGDGQGAVSQDDLDYENEHPAAKRMRLEFEAKYGRLVPLMRAANHWFNVRTQWNEAWNRDREQPITESDVAEAERAMLSAAPGAAIAAREQEAIKLPPMPEHVLADIQSVSEHLNMWKDGECNYVPKNGYDEPGRKSATIADVKKSAKFLAPRMHKASFALQDYFAEIDKQCLALALASPAAAPTSKGGAREQEAQDQHDEIHGRQMPDAALRGQQ